MQKIPPWTKGWTMWTTPGHLQNSRCGDRFTHVSCPDRRRGRHSTTIQRILNTPELGHQLSPNSRRCLTNRFPYGVIYSIRGNDFLIVAVCESSPKTRILAEPTGRQRTEPRRAPPQRSPGLRNPEIYNGCAALLPVDLYVPGCPPHPMTILDGLLRLLGRVADKR